MSTAESPPKPSTANKYEVFVQGQIERARRRVLLLDVGGAALVLLAGTLAYALGVAALDSRFELAGWVRQTAFVLFAGAGLLYAGVVVHRATSWRVNPFYAARQVENAVPEAKNSLVNWLDLHERELPAAIRGSLNVRAARDLARADFEQAISARRAGWLGGAVAGLFVGLFALFIVGGPRQFSSLLSRALAPFDGGGALASRTHLRILVPDGGDCTVPVGKEVSFAVDVDGKVPDPAGPDALRLLFHHQPSEPFESRSLERSALEGDWSWKTVVPAADVHNGFWYKVAGGDTETPEYRVQVHSTPLLTDFTVKYRFRPYVRRADETSHDPNLDALCGTRVDLVAQTNRTVKEGKLEMADGGKVRAELVPDQPQALRFSFPLERDGSYRIWFTSSDGETNTDPMPYTIKARPDQAPQVELTKPGKDIELPANDVLRLEGVASDDFGITGVTLRIRTDADSVESRVYRKDKSFQLADGGYPRKLEYQDFVDLKSVHHKNGQALQPGRVIEYWLEARDNCDYPEPNVGKSERFKIKILPPVEDAKKEKQDRDRARANQKKHEKDQDEQLSAAGDQQQNPQKDDGGPGKDGDKQARGTEQGDQKGAKKNDVQNQADKLEEAIKDRDKNSTGAQQNSKPDQSGDSNDKKQNEDQQPNGSDQGSNSRSGQSQQGKENSSGKVSTGGQKQQNGGTGQGTEQSKNGPGNQGGANADNKTNQNTSKAGQSKGNPGQDRTPGQKPQGDEQSGDQSANQDKNKGAKSSSPGSSDQSKPDGSSDQGANPQDRPMTDQGMGDQSQPNAGKSDRKKGKDQDGSKNNENQGAKSQSQPTNDQAAGKEGQPKGSQGDKKDKNQAGNGDTQNQGAKPEDQSMTGQGNEGKEQGKETKGGKTRDKAGKTDSADKTGQSKEGAGDDRKGQDKPEGKSGDQSAKQDGSHGAKPEKDKSEQADKSGSGSEEKKAGDGSKGEKTGSEQRGASQNKDENKPGGKDSSANRSAGNTSPEQGAKETNAKGDKNGQQGRGNPSAEQDSPSGGKSPDQEKARNTGGAGRAPDKPKSEKSADTKDQGTSSSDTASADKNKKPQGQGRGKPNAEDRGEPENRTAKGSEADKSEKSEGASRPSSKEGERKSGRPEDQAGKTGAGQTGREKATPAGDKEGRPENEPSKGPNDKSARSEGHKSGTGAKPERESPGKLDPKDVPDLIKALKNGDAKVRREAADKLKDLHDASNDPDLRKAVEEALAKSGGNDRRTGERSIDSSEKGAQGSDDGSGRPEPGSASEKNGKRPEQSAGGKEGGESKPSKDGADKPHRPSAQGEDGSNNADAGSGPNQEKGSDNASSDYAGDKPGGGTHKNRRREGHDADDGTRLPPTPADARFQRTASTLQLDNIKKHVDKDVLKRADMTEEDYRQFLKAYEAMLQKQTAAGVDSEKLSDPKARGGPLSNQKAHRVTPSGETKPDDVMEGDPNAPPQEFRPAYNKFTQDLADLERARNRKNP